MIIPYRLIFAGCVALLAIGVVGYTYNQGKTAGKNQIQLELDQQRAQWEKDKLLWEARVAEQTGIYIGKVNELTAHWLNKEELFRREIDRLKAHPEVIFVPRETPCTIPKGFVAQHNRAAQGEPLGQPPDDFADKSDKTLFEIGNKVATNYYTCNIIREQLITLQKIVKQYQQNQQELMK